MSLDIVAREEQLRQFEEEVITPDSSKVPASINLQIEHNPSLAIQFY
jgi:hypothetical protein